MTQSDADIARRLQLGEDSQWEFKQIEFSGNRPTSPRRDSLADEIAAFANADGGTLLCGATDAGEVQGLSREQMDALEGLLVNICTDAIRPPIRPIILRRVVNDRPLLVVEVAQGHAQHDSPGGSYHRVGSSKRLMTSDERLRLAQRRARSHKTPARANLPQYSEEALFEAVVNAVAHRDYSVRGSRTRLSMFNDRIEIQSPGSLPNNLTVDDMPHRQATRNELLTSLLGRVPAAGIKGPEGVCSSWNGAATAFRSSGARRVSSAASFPNSD